MLIAKKTKSVAGFASGGGLRKSPQTPRKTRLSNCQTQIMARNVIKTFTTRNPQQRSSIMLPSCPYIYPLALSLPNATHIHASPLTLSSSRSTDLHARARPPQHRSRSAERSSSTSSPTLPALLLQQAHGQRPRPSLHLYTITTSERRRRRRRWCLQQ